MSPLRMAVIGVGAIAEHHLEAIRAHPDVFELTAVCEPRADAAAEVVRRFPGARSFPSIAALVAEGEFDAAVIATPHFLHSPQALSLVESGHAVLIEKPAVTSTADLRLLQVAADRAGVAVVAGQTRRFDPESRLAKAMLDEDRFGALRNFDIQSLQDLRSYVVTVGPNHWLLDGEKAGGGVGISLAIHQLDLVRYLSGADYTRVMASARFDAPFRNGAESQLSALLELSNGATGTLQADYLASRIPFSEAMTLIGEHGTLSQHAGLGEYRGPISFSTSGGVASATFSEQLTGWAPVIPAGSEPIQNQESFTGQLLQFAEVVSRGADSESSLLTNFNTIACIEAMLRSARSGQPEEVEQW